jgi:hypothetical protein
VGSVTDQSGNIVGGKTNWLLPHETNRTFSVALNPFSVSMRTDSNGGSVCGQPRLNQFTNTLIHEARHAYQGAQAALPGNDEDNDWLINNPLPIALSQLVLDDGEPRTVCNTATGLPEFRAYKGPNDFDTALDPDWAYRAIEMDAYTFAANHLR